MSRGSPQPLEQGKLGELIDELFRFALKEEVRAERGLGRLEHATYRGWVAHIGFDWKRAAAGGLDLSGELSRGRCVAGIVDDD
jgi:hypothetical protein